MISCTKWQFQRQEFKTYSHPFSRFPSKKNPWIEPRELICGSGELEFSNVVTNCTSFSAKLRSPLISQHLLQPICVFSGGWGPFWGLELETLAVIEMSTRRFGRLLKLGSGLSWPLMASYELHLRSICICSFARRFHPKWIYSGDRTQSCNIQNT